MTKLVFVLSNLRMESNISLTHRRGYVGASVGPEGFELVVSFVTSLGNVGELVAIVAVGLGLSVGLTV